MKPPCLAASARWPPRPLSRQGALHVQHLPGTHAVGRNCTQARRSLRKSDEAITSGRICAMVPVAPA
eukprot:3231631-Alexandrium_andersonii.AAC.1